MKGDKLYAQLKELTTPGVLNTLVPRVSTVQERVDRVDWVLRSWCRRRPAVSSPLCCVACNSTRPVRALQMVNCYSQALAAAATPLERCAAARSLAEVALRRLELPLDVDGPEALELQVGAWGFELGGVRWGCGRSVRAWFPIASSSPVSQCCGLSMHVVPAQLLHLAQLLYMRRATAARTFSAAG